MWVIYDHDDDKYIINNSYEKMVTKKDWQAS